MPKIIDHVLRRKEEILADEAVARENQGMAELAVIGGITSPAWRTYMEQFCDKDDNGVANPQQLMRLIGTDGKPNLNRNRAYLVANGMCGDFTKAHFEENVQSIDEELTFPPTATPGCNPS
jgi:hypothetical protein